MIISVYWIINATLFHSRSRFESFNIHVHVYDNDKYLLSFKHPAKTLIVKVARKMMCSTAVPILKLHFLFFQLQTSNLKSFRLIKYVYAEKYTRFLYRRCRVIIKTPEQDLVFINMHKNTLIGLHLVHVLSEVHRYMMMSTYVCHY